MATDAQVFRARLTGTPKQLRLFLAQHPQEAERVLKEGEWVTVDAFVAAADLDGLRSRGLVVEVLYDADARGVARMAEVGKGNRFKSGLVPRGLGLRRYAR